MNEIWLNPVLRIRAIGCSLASTSTRYGSARIADRFGMKIRHENVPVTVDLIRVSTSKLRELWTQQSYGRQPSGGFRYNAEQSTLIYGRPSRICDRYCQIWINGTHIQIMFNQQYAIYTLLRAAKLPHPTKLAVTLANIALIKQGFLTIYGAAIESERRSVALLGLSKTGKTFITIQLCKNFQWRLLADDIFIVDRNGTVFPNPFTTGLDYMNPVRHKLIGRLLNDEDEKWGVLEHYSTIAVGCPASVESIYMLEKRGWGIGIQELTAQETADRVMAHNALKLTIMSDPFLQHLAYFQGWNVIDLYQTAHEIALSFSRHAKGVHELVARDTKSLATALQAQLTSTAAHSSIFDTAIGSNIAE